MTTPAVAHDLLTFIEAEAELAGQAPSDAKLWSYGVSYGTVTGATFASMFPDRVERMILDGVVNAEEYYSNSWVSNLAQMDEAMEQFSSLCYSAGPDLCSFWGPTSANITARLNNIIQQLQDHPVPLSNVESGGVPTMVTYADIKAMFVNAIYTPVTYFPVMADILHQFEGGNASTLAGIYEDVTQLTSDSNHVIQCVDGHRNNSLVTIEDFKGYVEYAVSESKYIGDIFPIYVDSILCRSFQPQLPDSMMVQGMAPSPFVARPSTNA